MTKIPPRSKLSIAPKYLAVLLLPIFAVAIAEAVLATFADTSVTLGDLVLTQKPEIKELIGRYRFLAVIYFYCAVCITVLGIFAAELLSRHTFASILRSLAGLVGLVLFSMLFSMFEPDWMGSFEAYELLGASLFETGLATGDLALCGADRCNDQGAFFAMRVTMDVVNVLSGLAVSAVILGMVLALARPSQIDLTNRAGILAEGATLQNAQKAVQRYLYLSGLLLSVAMVLGYAWMSWPAGLIESGATGYDDLVEAVSLYRGVTYTVLILSFYMPVSLIQMVRIERFQVAANATGLEDIAAQVKGFDIERIATLDALKAIVTILSPILASAVGGAISIAPFG
ncbi:MAG: hypothetical protein AB8B71_13975 [Paracoccaceae bacterium]